MNGRHQGTHADGFDVTNIEGSRLQVSARHDDARPSASGSRWANEPKRTFPIPSRWRFVTATTAPSHLRNRHARRGSVTSSLVLSLLSFGVLAAFAAVFGPRYLHATEPGGHQRHAQFAGHQIVLEGLGRLVSGAQGVIAVHERGPSPFAEVVLWLEDSSNAGVIDRHELVVVGHSRVLRTVTVYQTARQGGATGASWPADAPQLRSRAFCDQWRTDPAIRPRVIGTGISDMRIERIDESGVQRARYAITLTWAADSVDGADEATLFVDAIEVGAATEE
jgi:hypothetical protein